MKATGNFIGRLMVVCVFACSQICNLHAQIRMSNSQTLPSTSAIKQPLPPWPEYVLKRWDFDDLLKPVALRVDAVDDAPLAVSFSGYALDRTTPAARNLAPEFPSNPSQFDPASRFTDAPVVLPLVDVTGSTNAFPSRGTLRFWFKPETTDERVSRSAELDAVDELLNAAIASESVETSEIQPDLSPANRMNGFYPRLLELVSLDSPDNASVVWSLYFNPQRAEILLSKAGMHRPEDCLSASVRLTNDCWQLITLSWDGNGTRLYVNAQLMAEGSTLPSFNPATSALIVGSDWRGRHLAGGLFDDLTSLPGVVKPAALTQYFNGMSKVTQADMAVATGSLASRGATLNQTSSTLAASTMAFGSPDIGSGGGTNLPGDGPVLFSAIDYGTNLWLEILPPTNEACMVVLHNTLADQAYDLLSKSALTNAQWVLEQSLLASGDTLTTTVPVNLRTNFFLRARTTMDSDGDGLPDWYELEVTHTDPNNPDTGNTGTVDGYKDADNDGWTNIEEMNRGTRPDVWDTPAGAGNLRARYISSDNTIRVEWEPARGNPLYYDLVKYVDTVAVSTQHLTSATMSWTDTNPDTNKTCAYLLMAWYSGGQSSALIQGPFSSGGMQASLVMGSGRRFSLVLNCLSGAPASIEIGKYYGGVLIWTNVPLSLLVNGVVELPQEFNDWIDWNYKVRVSYEGGRIEFFSDYADVIHGGCKSNDPIAPWWDCREHMKDNLVFLLRGATVNESFSYETGFSYLFGSCFPWLPDDNNFWHVSDEYAESGFWNFKRSGSTTNLCPYFLMPLQYNNFHRHFTFDPVLCDASSHVIGYRALSANYLTNGQPYSPLDYAYLDNPFIAPIPSALNIAQRPSIFAGGFFFEDTDLWNNLGCVRGESNVVLLAGARNCFGLQINAVHLEWYDLREYCTLLPGETLSPEYWGLSPEYWAASYWISYIETEMPVLQNDGYLFSANTSSMSPVPGMPGFSPTNNVPPSIVSLGKESAVQAWAKFRIVNGYTNKFAYLGQYFDGAYTTDANGAATTNSAGILSEYGEFFPLEPGKIALVTKPDIDTGERGTGYVHVVKLQLDVNHDGVMDTSFTGPDNTSQGKPFVFWVNNDRDEPAASGKPERDEQSFFNIPVTQDWHNGHIRSKRNLEDFARLWVCGLPELPYSQSYTMKLSIVPSIGNPAVNLYAACDSSGSASYLTDTNAASAQFTQNYLNDQLIFDYARKLKTIDYSQSYTLPVSVNTGQPLYTHFLFEGAGMGSGKLVLTIYENTNVIAQTSAWIDLRDIKDLYEVAVVTNVQQGWPEMVQENRVSGFQVITSPDTTLNKTNEMVVFVHGWRMSLWEYFNFSETMFKRLYWQGYQGRLAAIRWPTRSGDTDPFLHMDYVTYNRSEHIAFKSGAGVAGYLNNLRSRFPNYTISVAAHSMGNIVMMEALKELAASNQAPVDNYVLMQGAVPAQCYDPTVTNLPALMETEQLVPTPDTYRNYAAGVTNALRSGGRLKNFFNPLDFALNTWLVNQKFYTSNPNGPITMKPTTFLGYYTDGTTHTLRTNYWNQQFLSIVYDGFYNGPTRTVTNLFEVMPLISRPRSLAVGAQGGVRGVVSQDLNLATQLGFTLESDDHSGQFNRNIQEPQVNQFYTRLLRGLLEGQP